MYFGVGTAVLKEGVGKNRLRHFKAAHILGEWLSLQVTA